ncbi:MAG: hypothetical protein ACWGQW_16795, partial [bacterium]
VRLLRQTRNRRSLAAPAPGDQSFPGNRGRQEPAKSFRWIVLFLGLSPAYFLLSDFRPVFFALAVSAFYTALIPILAGGLLWITNDSKLMRGQVNRWSVNLAMGLLIIISLFLTAQNVLEWFR